MRTASRILRFSASAVVLSTVFLGGTAHAADLQAKPADNGVTVTCGGNLNWDGQSPCLAGARAA